MPIKYKNGRVAKADDAVVGLDWRGAVVKGIAVAGDKSKGLPELVFQHEKYKTVCPSLRLEDFLLVDDAMIDTTGIHAVTAKLSGDSPQPAAPTGPAAPLA